VTKRTYPEQKLHIECIDALRRLAPDLIVFHPANGGWRSERAGHLFKAMGVLPGVSDLIFCLPDGRFAAIELKAGKGQATAAQVEFSRRVTNQNGFFEIIRSLDELLSTLERWGVSTKVHPSRVFGNEAA